MIKLSGFSIKDEINKKGDIEVKIIGLRPGEKLYEELLIGDKPQKTINPKIFKISETYIPYNQLKVDLLELKELLDTNNIKEVKKWLERVLKLYQSNSEIVDHVYNEQLLNKQNNKNLSFSEKEDNKIIKIK